MLTWNWTDKVGTWTEKLEEYEATYNMYKCNGLLVMLNEFEENGKEKYSMANFFADKEHLKNCLGISKGYDNIYKNYEIKIEIYEHCKATKTLIENINKAEFDKPITIVINPEIPF